MACSRARDLIGETVDQQAIVSPLRAVLGGQVDRRPEAQAPARRPRQQAGRAQQRKVGVTGMNGRPALRANHVTPRHHRHGVLGADHGDRDDRHAPAKRELDEAAAAEALQPVAIAPQLARALGALREDRHQLAASEQPLGVLGTGAHPAESVDQRPERR
jgi:hypothetical protein